MQIIFILYFAKPTIGRENWNILILSRGNSSPNCRQGNCGFNRELQQLERSFLLVSDTAQCVCSYAAGQCAAHQSHHIFHPYRYRSSVPLSALHSQRGHCEKWFEYQLANCLHSSPGLLLIWRPLKTSINEMVCPFSSFQAETHWHIFLDIYLDFFLKLFSSLQR